MLYPLFQPLHGSPNVTVPTCTIKQVHDVTQRFSRETIFHAGGEHPSSCKHTNRLADWNGRMCYPTNAVTKSGRGRTKPRQADEHFLLLLQLLLLQLSCELVFSYPQIVYKNGLKICSYCILVLDLTRNGSKHVQKCMYRFVPVDSDFTTN